MEVLKFIFITLLTISQHSEAANILFYQVCGSKSHKISMFPLAKELSHRGHNVTYITLHEPFEKVKGLKEIIPKMDFEMKESFFEANGFMDRVNGKLMDSMMLNLPRVVAYTCEKYLAGTEAQILKSPETNGGSRFDMVVIDFTLNECILPTAHLHDSIVIQFGTTGFYPFSTEPTDNPNPIPYVGAFTVHYPDNRYFLNRVISVLDVAGWYICRHFKLFPIYNELFEKYIGPGIPDVAELERRVSFTMLNSHFSVDMPMPFTPSVVSIGCLHCKPANPVSDKAMRTFLDESGEDGFVLFSLGSFVSESQVPEVFQRKLLETFGRLKQRVLWKWDGRHLEGEVPQNVLLTKWVPQNDVLGHPNIRCFISHGGKLSTEETLYHGVPVIVMAIFGDQELHAHLAETRGYGRKFEPADILNGDELFNTITEVVYTKSFQQNARKFSNILRDQLNDPMEKAVYWVEYLLRHNGAPHLQSNVKNFTFFQYYLIDVYLFFIVIVTFTVFLFVMFIKLLMKFCLSNTNKTKKD